MTTATRVRIYLNYVQIALDGAAQELYDGGRMKKLPKSRSTRKRLIMLDDDKRPVRSGNTISFIYGIPPACVRAKLVQRGSRLIALTPGHNPTECNLRSLRRYVGAWFKSDAKGS